MAIVSFLHLDHSVLSFWLFLLHSCNLAVLVGPGAQEDEDDVFEPLDMNRTCRDQITMAR